MFYKNLTLMFGLIVGYVFIANAQECQLIPKDFTSTDQIDHFSENNLRVKTKACGLRIGDSVPSFTAESTQGPINFPDDFGNKWIILFSHPADFTPVCATEFKRLAEINNRLKKTNCQLIGISVDSSYTHKMWLESLGLAGNKPEDSRKVDFPVIGDVGGTISKKLGMIHPNENKTQTVRSIYFIDPNHKIRALFYYPIANGRNFDEMERLLYALQETYNNNVATPAGWKPGDKTISKDEADKGHYA